MSRLKQISVDDAILTRRSVRAFRPDPVPRETVEHILDIAARAPSGTNIQPWHVYVVTGTVRDEISAAVMKRREEGPEDEPDYVYYPRKWREPYLARRRKVGYDLYGLLGIEKGDKPGMWAQFGRNYVFFDAPVGLFFTVDKDLEVGSWIDMGMFLENVMIAARGQGLHTCPQAAWVGYHRTVREILGIPDSQALVCGMCLGYEDAEKVENELRTDREPADDFAKFLGFEE